MSTATALGEAVGLVPFYMGHELAVQLAIFCGFFLLIIRSKSLGLIN
jgi:hypothetical protein